MTAIALCALALADASFSGFRAHAGRDGRIVKRDAKVAAAVTGLVPGLVVLATLAALLLGSIAISATTLVELEAAGARMLLVYGWYALAVTLGFAAYFSPWLEVRSLATMLILGPGTFIRPVIILGGATAGAIDASWFVGLSAFLAAGLMLAIEPALWRWFDAQQATTIVPFVPAPKRRFSRLSRSEDPPQRNP